MAKPLDWARSAADQIVEEFSEREAVITANEQLRLFILAAAELAAEDHQFADMIGKKMMQRLSKS